MTQINIPTKQKQTHRYREQTCGCQGDEDGEKRTGSIGPADANHYIQDEQTKFHCIAQGTTVNTL